MLMCYVDESGDTGLFDANERNSQPVFLLCALMVNQSRLESITREVIHLKQSHFPSYSQGIQHWHDWLKANVKAFSITANSIRGIGCLPMRLHELCLIVERTLLNHFKKRQPVPNIQTLLTVRPDHKGLRGRIVSNRKTK